jgi:hypothetical protein
MKQLEAPARSFVTTSRLGLCMGLLLAPLALAQSDPASPPNAPGGARFEMNLGAGIVVPITFSTQDPAALAASLPLRTEIGLRIKDRIFLGLLGEYVPASDMGCCCAASPGYCSASTARIGLEIDYHFGAIRSIHPWIGVAGGLELLRVFASGDVSGSGVYVTNTSNSQGWFGEFQLGLDIPVGQIFRLGPWIQFSLGSIGGDLSDYGGNIRGRAGGGIRFGIVL